MERKEGMKKNREMFSGLMAWLVSACFFLGCVEKGGEIIPKIVGVDRNRRKPGSKPVEFIMPIHPLCRSVWARLTGV